MKRAILYISIIFLFSGCSQLLLNKPDISLYNYQEEIRDKIKIPDVCKKEYQIKKTRVAVVNFANNSTFGNSRRVYNSYDDYRNRDSANDKSYISEALTPIMENVIAHIPSASLYTRRELKRVLKEQKLQDSGLFNEKTLVEFGNLTGVKYIITGSLDNVKIKNRNYSTLGDLAAFAALHSNNRKTQILGLLASIGTHLIDGVILDVFLTVRMIDVQTGEIVYSKQVSDSVNIGEIDNPSFEEIVGGIKAGAIKALPKVKEDIAKKFEIRGYIMRIKKNGNRRIIQINLGQKELIKRGDKFLIYNVDVNIDPFNNKKSCEIYPTSNKIVITNQIGFETSWGILKGDINRVKIYQLVKRIEE